MTKTYEIVRKTTWTEVPFLEVDQQPWFTVDGIEMKVQLMWDEDKLYVHELAKEKNIRAVYKEHMDPVFEDSCMEFFLAPFEGDSRYFNFEMNPNGALLLCLGENRNNRCSVLPKDASKLFNIRTQIKEDFWEASYELPVSFFKSVNPRFDFKQGLSMKANFYKCGDNTKKVHYLTWNRMTSANPDYHRYCDFGTIILK